MAEEQKKATLFTEFPPVPTSKWEEQITADLKGADYDKKLVWKTLEGLSIKPYYREESLKGLEYLQAHPGEFPFVRGNNTNNNEWLIRQDIIVTDISGSNSKALNAIKGGATAIGFILEAGKIKSSADLETLLKGIDLNTTVINMVVKYNVLELLGWLSAVKSIDAKKSKINIEFDPISNLELTGSFLKSEKEDFETIQQFIVQKLKTLPSARLICVDAKNFGNAGGSVVQELAFGLSAGTEYIARLTDLNLKVDDIAASMQFNFSLGSNFFMEMAKIRAARILWAAIVEAYKPSSLACSAMFIHCETGNWNKTAYDAYVNMLRSTTESMSAVLAGVNSLTVNPFDCSFNTPNDFSERVARNTQIILKEESYLDKVVDPAAGSYYIENLTDSIVSEAWKLFLETEQKGGFLAAFKSGFIQNQISEIAKKRDLNIATRKEILLGTNQYPNFSEVYTGKPLTADPQLSSNLAAKPLHIYRASQGFESLRFNTDKQSKRPKVFMLTVGNPIIRKARASFSCNFFACAGYEVIDNAGFATVEEGVKKALTNKADMVILCSSDEEYPDLAPKAIELLKGKAIFVVAGAPACMEELKQAGIEHFIHVKSNVLETLVGFNKLLDIN